MLNVRFFKNHEDKRSNMWSYGKLIQFVSVEEPDFANAIILLDSGKFVAVPIDWVELG